MKVINKAKREARKEEKKRIEEEKKKKREEKENKRKKSRKSSLENASQIKRTKKRTGFTLRWQKSIDLDSGSI